MYNFSYAETLDEFCVDARGNERQAMGVIIEQLQAAKEKGRRSREAIEAIYNTRRVWAYLIDDLSNERNELPVALRADLISIGLWVMKELEAIRTEQSESFDGLIQINTMIRDGLA
ncbi:flagellar protein FlaF [Breoghania corrubedonensis]|uniref:Flagellar protein FlaF n=1 Tax=Breoghania corrubedonensis TaxID=665038 RepID=A0A2T5V8S6_9HYPH|nr:flagellar biosynthesis regulator FlaF [Breoghania corrubedonensis]PTW60165.1 flagellar protein FlaF [Breoghania corrubedonensis]